MRIELAHLPDPDLNPNKRLHHHKRARLLRDAKEEVGWLILQQGRPQKPIEKAHIAITWVAGDKRRRDPDNLFASMKAYIDGLVAGGLIIDDSAEHVSYAGPRYEWGERNNTIIEVREL